jgi:hypothetical protein
MQWKDDKTDIYNKIVRNLEHVLVGDSLMPNKDHTDIIRNEKSLVHNTDQEMNVKEVDVNENAFQLAQLNEDCLNEIGRVTYDQTNKINKNELD